MIIRKFVNIEQRANRCEPVSSLPDKTIPGQSYSIEELLRRSQNGTFPDINFNIDYEQDMLPDSSDGSDVRFDEHDFIDHMDFGEALTEVSNVKKHIDNVINNQKIKSKNKKTKKTD